MGGTEANNVSRLLEYGQSIGNLGGQHDKRALSLPLALLPDPAVLLAQLTPMFPVVDLVYLGVAGIRITGDTVAGSELLWTVLLDAAVLVGWTVAGLFLVRRRFRWEPRR